MLKDNMYSMVDHTRKYMCMCIQQQAIRVSQDSKSPSSTTHPRPNSPPEKVSSKKNVEVMSTFRVGNHAKL